MNVPDGLPSLAHGGHEPGDGEACIMELVGVLAGEPWGDQPNCVHPMLQTAAVIVNDHLTDDKRDLIRPLIGRFFGTNPLDGVDLVGTGYEVFGEAVQKMAMVTEALTRYFWLPADADVSPKIRETTEQRRVSLSFDQLCNTLNVDAEETYAQGTTWAVAEAMVAWLSGALDVYDSAVGRERGIGREITEADVKLAQETIALAI